MTSTYNAAAIEVLSGLDPVRKRPGMYTDTTRPNHLAQEVIDNSVDEALAGHARTIAVTVLYADGSLEVSDDGRGMPVDIHPDEGLPGVEVILTKLHAGGKFSNESYRFAGGLHGVGVSVVNALSQHLEVWVKRDGQEYNMAFAHGDKVSDLEPVGKVPRKETGTRLRFWPDHGYFDSPRFSTRRLKHLLQAKAVLCPGLTVSFRDEASQEETTWYYEDGLKDYLLQSLPDREILPADPFTGNMEGTTEAAAWALVWLPAGGEPFAESYVNLIPTVQGGTHVNGLRTGLTEAVRDFCEFRNLLPRGVKLAPEDVWARCAYILSVKLLDPQFPARPRNASPPASAPPSSPASSAMPSASGSTSTSRTARPSPSSPSAPPRPACAPAAPWCAKRSPPVPPCPASSPTAPRTDPARGELFLVEGDSAGGSAKQARDREFQAILPLRGKILNTWEVDSSEVLGSQEVHDIAVAIGVDPGDDDLSRLRFGKVCVLADADSDGAHIATLLCALFLRHFPRLVAEGHVYVALPPLYRIDVGKQVFYALDEDEKRGILDRIAAEKLKGKVNVQRFKGLGEMNPGQLRETSIHPDTRRLVQLTVDDPMESRLLMDMLLAKKRASDRRAWLQDKGDLAEVTL
jgi:topoisomerase-4 subunit B